MKNKICFPVFFFLPLILITYLPFIFYGGYGSGDDMRLINISLDHPNVINWIKSMLLGSASARPISSVILVLVHFLFKNNPSLYIITGILTWILSVFLLCLILRNFMNKSSIYIFSLLALFPFFATAIFSGPFLFTQYVIPIIFFSLSLISLLTHAKNGSFIYYFCGWLLLAFSLLTLSYILPLLILTAFFPAIYEYSQEDGSRNKNLDKLILKYFLPTFVVACLFFVFKVYLVSLYANITGIYGLTPLSLKSLLQAFYFFIVIIIEIPSMLIQIVPYMLKWQVLISGSFIIIFFYLIRKELLYDEVVIKNSSKKLKEKLFIASILISLIFSCFIFLISGYPATTFGIYNRMLLPSFIIFSILISWFFSKMLLTRLFFVPIIISTLWISSIIVQLDNFIKSWEIREKIASDLSIKLNSFDLGENPILVANMPYFLKNNYNNEEVTFCTWAFDAHLKLAGAPEITAWPISYRIVTDPLFYPAHNIFNNLSSISDDENIWYYEYEEGSDKGMFKNLGNKKALLEKFEEIKVKKINYHPIILREKIRLAFKKLPLVWEIYNQKLPEKIKQNI